MALRDVIEKTSDSLGALLKKESGSVLGVDVSSSTIKVVQLAKKRGKAILETYGELALGPYAGVDIGKSTKLPADKMSEALVDLMKEAQVTTTACGVAIPLSSSLINVIEMPDVGERRLKEMVPIEMRKYIPVSISEVMLDWRVIPRSEYGERAADGDTKKRNKTDVLVVAIHNDTIDTYRKIIDKAKLDASFFEIEVFSTLRSVLDSSASTAMVIDIGAGTTKVFITEHRVLRESHIINRGAQDVTLAIAKSLGISNDKAAELKRSFGVKEKQSDPHVREVMELVLGTIFSEAHRILLNYQKRRQKNIPKIFISGGGAVMRDIGAAAAEALETEVVLANPFSKVVAPAFLEGVLEEAGPEFAVAIGVALRKLEEAE